MAKKKYPEWIRTKSERAMHDDFRKFLYMVWRHLGLPAPTPLQYDMAKYIQSGPKRRIVQAFRGCGKSWITAAFVLWLLWRDPQLKILVISASKDRADAFSIFVKRLIHDIPLLNFLAPRPGQRDSNIAFDVGPSTPDQSPSVKSSGITSQITGTRGDYIIPDDVEVPNNSMTEDQREKLAVRVAEFDAILKPGGQIINLGTPQTAQSLYGILESRGYKTRIWPARYTTGIELDDDGDEVIKYGGNLAPMIRDAANANPELIGTSTEPTRFTDEDLAEREASYGRSGFALQFMLDTSLSDSHRYPLKIKDLMVMDLDKKIAPVQLTYGSGHEQVIEGIPNVGLNGDRLVLPMYTSDAHVPYQGAVMHIDPSGRGNDECAYAVTKMLNGLIFITAWGGIRGSGYDETTLTALALVAKVEGVNEIFTESNFGDGMFNALFSPVLARLYPCTLDEFLAKGQKELRIIEKLEPAMNQHRVVIDKSVAAHNSTVDESGSAVRCGLYQLAHITKDRGSLKHDDRIDVLAQSVGYWRDQLEMDNRNSEEVWREREKQKALDEFMKSCGKNAGNGNRSFIKNIHRH